MSLLRRVNLTHRRPYTPSKDDFSADYQGNEFNYNITKSPHHHITTSPYHQITTSPYHQIITSP